MNSSPSEPSPPDDLVAKAVSGDDQALEELLEAHGPAVAQALRISPAWARVIHREDVIQVTFLEAFLRIGTLKGQSTAEFVGWLRTIAKNNLNDAIRAFERDKRPESRGRVTRGPSGESSATLLGQLLTEGTGIGTRAGQREEIELLSAALAELPESYRSVIQALDLNEEPLDDVAERMGRSKGAVHMLRSRGHDRLREILQHQLGQ